MRVLSWNLALLPSLLASGLGAQSYALDRCTTPREPLGILRGSGEVRYRLGRDGKPDTTSLAVLSVNGISVGGFRSAAVRQLSACKMRKPHDGAVVVSQRIRFDATRLAIDPALPADTSVAALAAAPAPLPANTLPDTLLEESPRLIHCGRVPEPLGPRERTFTSREEMETELARDSRQNSGRILTRLVIDTTGRVIPDSITVLSSDNPVVTNNLRSTLASCRYTPGRVGGVPVQTAVKRGSGIQIVNELPPR